MDVKQITDILFEKGDIEDKYLKKLIESEESMEYLFKKADEKRREIYSDKVYLRGLIEISSYCKNNCLYCGIRASNKNSKRFRLEKEEILSCARHGYETGFRTFVLQGGEDGFYDDDYLSDVVSSLKKEFPECAVTLSLGERSEESYKTLKRAGADRYLLRHETGDKDHYESLHPKNMSFENRIECLVNLKKTGYQTGSGFMVGTPGQTTETLIKDLRLLQKLQPEMIGIGPFIPHRDTPFKNEEAGNLELTLKMIAILRLMFPYALIPSTTALATLDKKGRIKGLLAGANVVMPNLSPKDARENYNLYDNKAHLGAESIEGIGELREEIENAGYRISWERGDALTKQKTDGNLKT
ncbi:MAG: [FeFe] hydrogenase H-cluster radical SAM maturase HydE [Ruminococcaceae bacterium]|nr:[FeFe] hydrogenase H-cluster radical SAM maturase HydE [Oscillospiraceae bacterium]